MYTTPESTAPHLLISSCAVLSGSSRSGPDRRSISISAPGKARRTMRTAHRRRVHRRAGKPFRSLLQSELSLAFLRPVQQLVSPWYISRIRWDVRWDLSQTVSHDISHGIIPYPIVFLYFPWVMHPMVFPMGCICHILWYFPWETRPTAFSMGCPIGKLVM